MGLHQEQSAVRLRVHQSKAEGKWCNYLLWEHDPNDIARFIYDPARKFPEKYLWPVYGVKPRLQLNRLLQLLNNSRFLWCHLRLILRDWLRYSISRKHLLRQPRSILLASVEAYVGQASRWTQLEDLQVHWERSRGSTEPRKLFDYRVDSEWVHPRHQDSGSDQHQPDIQRRLCRPLHWLPWCRWRNYSCLPILSADLGTPSDKPASSRKRGQVLEILRILLPRFWSKFRRRPQGRSR